MEKTKEFDFTKVTVEMQIDVFEEADLSKVVGNCIHQSTADIGMDDIAREIYRHGKAKLTKEQAAAVNTMVQRSNLIIAVKTAITNLLYKK